MAFNAARFSARALARHAPAAARQFSAGAARTAPVSTTLLGAVAAASAAGVAAMAAQREAECATVTTTTTTVVSDGAADAAPSGRANSLLPSPKDAKYKLAVVEYNIPGELDTDKCMNGHRPDTIPIANGVIKAGGACDVIKYKVHKHADFEAAIAKYDALIVRINPGQISVNTPPGSQKKFDDLMYKFIGQGKLVWSSPDVQTKMGAKDALCAINQLSCGLPDTLAYYSPEDLERGFKKTCAYQPRVIKQNRGSAGEGIWLCWLQDKPYCSRYGDSMLQDNDRLKLMEMNDNHVEYHTVREFLEFCEKGPGGAAGEWQSTFPGKYLAGGKEAGGQLVDQRLLPRITEGEVRCFMVKDEMYQIIHKKPTDGGMSAVGGISAYTFYSPDDPKFADLKHKFLNQDLPQLKKALKIEDQPLPLVWTADFIVKDAEDGTPNKDEYVVGEFNCSCVGISKFGAACSAYGKLEDVTDANFAEGTKLTDLIGRKALETCAQELKK